MRIVVADLNGIVSSAIRTGFERKKSPIVDFMRASTWSQVVKAIQGQESVILLSAQLIKGPGSATALAKQAKEVNPSVIFAAYDPSGENYGPEVDFAIPNFKRSPETETPGEWVAEFIIFHAMKGEGRTRQMSLF